ncbi:hypothetical protein ACGF5M_03885 [Gemmatimonadota bacterium]
MSARIEIGKWVVRADEGVGWVVGEPGTRFDKRVFRDVETMRDPTYHGRLDHTLTSLLDRFLRESEVRSIQDVAEEIRRFRDDLADVFALPEAVRSDDRSRRAAGRLPDAPEQGAEGVAEADPARGWSGSSVASVGH